VCRGRRSSELNVGNGGYATQGDVLVGSAVSNEPLIGMSPPRVSHMQLRHSSDDSRGAMTDRLRQMVERSITVEVW
jgi:hypothetical protein